MTNEPAKFYVYGLLERGVGTGLFAGPYSDRAIAERLASGPGPERKVIEASSDQEAGQESLVAFGLQLPRLARFDPPAPGPRPCVDRRQRPRAPPGR